ncbi:unnamed protein product [Paramecium octaurelia]|uniref:EF-hand domain-containing protein n=1 Tax=Paramecium octaurelia TaxID=43137 RepID=A0A8S1VY44_PAROT|nr:unnamed protein product [Paramecium octaurelia]
MASSVLRSQIPLGGICDVESAKHVARRLFESYDRDRNGILDQGEVAPMMVDAYKGMSKGFNPSKSDIDTYLRILDRNGDGKITIQDIEALAIKYLVGITGESPKRPKRQYSKFVEERLDVARRLFRKFDQDGSGFITENEVPQLLIETYKSMGIHYNPTQEDVKSWMRMTDLNDDGQVSLEEYEDLVIRSLQHAGIQLE